MQQSKRFSAGILLFILLTVFFAWYQAQSKEHKDIDFNDVEPSATVSSVTSNPQALRMAVSPVLSPTKTIAYYRAIANYLSAELKRPVILIQRENYGEVGTLLLNGGADIAFFSSGEYAAYSGFSEIELLVGQERHGLPFYQGYLVVPKDSSIQDISQLRGKSVAFTDPLSYSGYMFIAWTLQQQNETPESFFGSYVYTYSHDKSLRAVANKIVDAAPVTSFAYDEAKVTMPEVAAAVKIIGISPKSGIGPVVISKKIPTQQRKVLKETFLKMHEEPSLKEALQGLMITKFTTPQPELYDVTRKMLQIERKSK